MAEGKQTKSEATRARILNTALGLFAERGFAATTMREIAAAAGCSLGLAYRYFPTKEAMVLALYARLVEDFAEEIRALPPGPLATRWARATRGDFLRLSPHRGALAGLTSAGLAPARGTQVLGPDAAPARHRMLEIFGEIVGGSNDAPRRDVADALPTLLYALHLLLVFFWLQDPSPSQRITGQLVDFVETMLRRTGIMMRVRWVSRALIQLASILSQIISGDMPLPPDAEPAPPHP